MAMKETRFGMREQTALKKEGNLLTMLVGKSMAGG